MTIRLRPHHLLCMLTFVGKGYTPDFTANYRRIAARLSAGEDLLIVSGPDDICGPLLADADAHCFGAGVVTRDRLALQAVSHLLGRPVAPGSHVDPDAAFLERMRTAFRTGGIREACEACEWAPLCSRIAAEDYRGVAVRRA